MREAIQRGDYAPTDRLPTEKELADFYRVSRDTVRRALSELVREGWVDTFPTLGTFIRPRPAVLPRRYSRSKPRGGPYHTDASGQRLENSEMRLLRVEVAAADEELAAWLEIAEGAEVTIRRRHWLMESEVVQIFDSYLPRDLVRGTILDSATMAPHGTYHALEEAGHRPVRFAEEVAARAPTPDEMSILRLGETTPVLEVRRTTRDADGKVIEGLRVVGGADRNIFVYEDLPVETTASLK